MSKGWRFSALASGTRSGQGATPSLIVTPLVTRMSPTAWVAKSPPSLRTRSLRLTHSFGSRLPLPLPMTASSITKPLAANAGAPSMVKLRTVLAPLVTSTGASVVDW